VNCFPRQAAAEFLEHIMVVVLVGKRVLCPLVVYEMMVPVLIARRGRWAFCPNRYWSWNSLPRGTHERGRTRHAGAGLLGKMQSKKEKQHPKDNH